MTYKMNWLVIIPATILWVLMCLVVVAFVTYDAVASIRDGPGLTVVNWATVIMVDLGCLGGIGYTLWDFYADANVVITDDYVSRPTLFGVRYIRWADVKNVRGSTSALYIYGTSGRIVVSQGRYLDGEAIKA